MSTRKVDIVIVGAGVAGLAAMRRAMDLGLDALLFEASGRIGGRVHSVARPDGSLWDRGAHWLRQPAVNPLVHEAEKLQIDFRRPWLLNGGIVLDGEWMADMRADEVWHQIDEVEDLARELAAAGEDASLLDLVDPSFTDRDAISAVLTHTFGCEPHLNSATDASRFSPTEGAWPVSDGFGTLIHGLYAAVPVELNTPVTVIDWGSDPVRVDLGVELVEADYVLITVSTAVLASERIVFAPQLPADVALAIERLPLGSMNRVILDLDGVPDLPADSFVYSVRGNESVALAVPEAGSTALMASVSGQLSRALEEAGDDEMFNVVAEHAIHVFGSSCRLRFDQAEATAWGRDSNMLGTTAVPSPGSSLARSTLRQGIEQRLFFAGEALSLRSFGTVHGAMQSGIDAVNTIANRSGLHTQIPSTSDNPDLFLFDL